MNKKYYYSFGVEIHAQLMTKSKAFSKAKADNYSTPNTHVHPFDLGYPGSKPIVNKKMVELSYRLAKNLNMKITDIILFDRKNYFYPDLGPGYQITQHFNPIGIDGTIVISTPNGDKKILIERIQMEQDTAKQIVKDGFRYFDFNRAGIPLVEIISDHKQLNSIDEVISYINNIRQLLNYLEICDTSLNKGTFRIDVNVSISPKENSFGPRTEIKNLNSMKNIRSALDFEIKRKITSANNNVIEEVETKRFDEKSQSTILMRKKNTQREYMFFPEANILPIKLDAKLISSFEKFDHENFFTYKNQMIEKVGLKNIDQILFDHKLFMIFKKLNTSLEVEKFANIITNKLTRSINIEIPKIFTEKKLDENLVYSDEYIEVWRRITILILNKKNISEKEIVSLFRDIINDKNFNKLDTLEKIEVVSNKEIETTIKNLINESDKLKKELVARPDRAQKYIVGQIMKETKGAANPQEVIEIIKKLNLI